MTVKLCNRVITDFLKSVWIFSWELYKPWISSPVFCANFILYCFLEVTPLEEIQCSIRALSSLWPDQRHWWSPVVPAIHWGAAILNILILNWLWGKSTWPGQLLLYCTSSYNRHNNNLKLFEGISSSCVNSQHYLNYPWPRFSVCSKSPSLTTLLQ